MKTVTRLGQQKDETPMEYLSRAIGHLGYESCNLLDTLPTVEAVLDFFDLWYVYGTDYWAGVLECIAEGESPKAARAFIKKHKLPKGWSDDVAEAVKESVETARSKS